MIVFANLPDIQTLKRRMQSLAMLDALLCPEWEFRYFSFNGNWDHGEEMGSIRDGSGNEVYVLFTPQGCYIKEFLTTQPTLTDAYTQVPDEFRDATREPAFSPDNVTACYWRGHQAGTWGGKGPSGASDLNPGPLLAMVDGRPETYERFAEDYHEVEVPSDVVSRLFAHQPMSDRLLKSVGFTGSLEDLRREADEIGYPGCMR